MIAKSGGRIDALSERITTVRDGIEPHAATTFEPPTAKTAATCHGRGIVRDIRIKRQRDFRRVFCFVLGRLLAFAATGVGA